jgi:hypothetical protein
MISPTDISKAIRKKKRYYRSQLQRHLGISAAYLSTIDKVGAIPDDLFQKWAEFHEIPANGIPAFKQYNERYTIWVQIQNYLPFELKNRGPILDVLRDLIYFEKDISWGEYIAKVQKDTLKKIMRQCYEVHNGLIDALEASKNDN